MCGVPVCFSHACLLPPEDPSHISFPAAPCPPFIAPYSQPSVNMWVNALNLSAYLSGSVALKESRWRKKASLLICAQPLTYRAQVALLLRGFMSWLCGSSPF